MEVSDPFVSILQNLASIDALTNEVNFLLRNVSTQVHDVAALQGLVVSTFLFQTLLSSPFEIPKLKILITLPLSQDFVQKLSDLGHQINFKLHCRIQHAKLRVISEPSTWFYKGCSVCSKKNCSAHHAPLGHISFYRIKVAIKDHTEKEIEAIMFGQVVKDLFHHTAQELEILKEKVCNQQKKVLNPTPFLYHDTQTYNTLLFCLE